MNKLVFYIRIGVPGVPGLEDTFNTHAIDLAFWGHEHSYERMWPVYNRNVYNLTTDPYHNAPAPIYIVTGSAVNYFAMLHKMDEN